mmetsp:Transcript_78018/g.252539  ORF Transcript_78018/g.252539 Transcript_78018/m.252539 type:complete len:224 (-) Transcript_78018:1044-1715(-)
MSAVRLPWALAVMWSGSAFAVSAAAARAASSRSAAFLRCACTVAHMHRPQRKPFGSSWGGGKLESSSAISSRPRSMAMSRAEDWPGPGATSKPARSIVRTRLRRQLATASRNHSFSGRCVPYCRTTLMRCEPTLNQTSSSTLGASLATWSHHQRATWLARRRGAAAFLGACTRIFASIILVTSKCPCLSASSKASTPSSSVTQGSARCCSSSRTASTLPHWQL